ncbi:MAG: outer membrane beta-barrel protein [Bacteroidota bacterium]
MIARILACAIIILSCSVTMQAQQRFRASIMAGGNLSQIDGDRLQGYNRIGLNVGAKVAAMLTDTGRWQLSLEINYSQRGSSSTPTDDPNSIYESIRLNTVEVPVMVHFKDWRFLFSGGFIYNRLINFTTIDRTGLDITDGQTYSPDIFSFALGATFFFTENIGLNIRWSRSMTDIQANVNDSSFIDRTVTVRGVYEF